MYNEHIKLFLEKIKIKKIRIVFMGFFKII